MTPIKFEQSNIRYGPPPDLAESQCLTIYAYQGVVAGGSVDGSNVVITAWKPSLEELAELNAGGAVFLCCIGGLPPHYLATSFAAAIAIA